MSVQFVNSSNDFQNYLSANKYLMANFTASWCGPCQAIKPVIDQLYSSGKYDKIEICRVDLDTQKDLATKYQVTAVPTFIFFEQGKEISRIRGADVHGVTNALDSLNVKASVDSSVKARSGNASGSVVLSGVEKEVKDFIPKGFEILNSSIDFQRFEALNVIPLYQDKEVQDLFKLDDANEDRSTVWSDADSQLLFFIPFLNICKIYSVLIKIRKQEKLINEDLVVDEEDLSSESQLPNIIKVWPNSQTILSFDDAADSNSPHEQKIDVDDDDEDLVNGKWIEAKFKFVRFQNVQNLNIFFEGDDDDYHTIIDKIVIVGLSGESKNQGKIQSLEPEE
ncbi:txl1 [[Candida] subhashii]|uniref:Txl1 n=1 Tax=[Candida] subhashii TaxID=561895 RepID=A0A8J5QL32_9ASCO|nr:txl1 [[Candida] subhashii]KAG7662423.1 txl1 [[Candida] subhashii]